MPYAVLADFKTRIGDAVYAQITDLSGGTTPSDTVGQARLDDADGFIDGKLATRYATPIDTTGNAAAARTLKAIAVAVAYDACVSMHPDLAYTIPKGIDKEQRKWLKMLEDIANGTASLPGDVPLPSSTSPASTAEVQGNAPVFGSDSLEGLP